MRWLLLVVFGLLLPSRGAAYTLENGNTNFHALMKAARAHRREEPFDSGPWAPVEHKGRGGGDFPQLPYLQTADQYEVVWDDYLPRCRVRLRNSRGEWVFQDAYIVIEVPQISELNKTSGVPYNGTSFSFLGSDPSSNWTGQVWERSGRRRNFPSFSSEISNFGQGNSVIMSSTLPNGALIEMAIGIFDQEETISIEAPNLPVEYSGVYTYVLDRHSAKFSIYVENWPFLADDSVVQVRADLLLSEAFSTFNPVPVDRYRNRYEVATQYYEMNITSQNITLSDGLILPEVGLLNFFPTNQCAVCGIRLNYEFESFENYTFYDPDFSILVSAEDGSALSGDGGGGDSKGFDPIYLTALTGISCVVPLALCVMSIGLCCAVVLVPGIGAAILARRHSRHSKLVEEYAMDPDAFGGEE